MAVKENIYIAVGIKKMLSRSGTITTSGFGCHI